MTIGGPTFKAALKAAGDVAWATELASATVPMWSDYGWPASTGYNDIVSFGAVTSDAEPATFGANHSREETLTCQVDMLIFRGGDQEQVKVVEERALYLLNLLAEYCRTTNSNLSGAVRWCFLTSYATDADPNFDTAMGRRQFLTSTFTAKYRIT